MGQVYPAGNIDSIVSSLPDTALKYDPSVYYRAKYFFPMSKRKKLSPLSMGYYEQMAECYFMEFYHLKLNALLEEES